MVASSSLPSTVVTDVALRRWLITCISTFATLCSLSFFVQSIQGQYHQNHQRLFESRQVAAEAQPNYRWLTGAQAKADSRPAFTTATRQPNLQRNRQPGHDDMALLDATFQSLLDDPQSDPPQTLDVQPEIQLAESLIGNSPLPTSEKELHDYHAAKHSTRKALAIEGHATALSKNWRRPDAFSEEAAAKRKNIALARLKKQHRLFAEMRQSELDNRRSVETDASTTAIDRPNPHPQSTTASIDKRTLFATEDSAFNRITGFLKPDGFHRVQWQKLSRDLALTPTANAKEKFVIMLDPGHGGSDPGSIAHNGLLEKELTLDIAKRVRKFLSEYDDLEVLLTRNHDHGLSRLARVNVIKNSNADMVVSLHLNHLPQSDLKVVESFYAGPKNVAESRAQLARKEMAKNPAKIQHAGLRNGVDISFTKGSKRLANTLHRHIVEEISFGNENVLDAGVREKTLFVLTRSYKPGALIELTCLSNVSEAERLTTDSYKNRIAAALADGIRSYRDSLRLSPLHSSADVGA